MGKFANIFNTLLSENNVAGGTGSVFGTVDSGGFGGQFPSQNSLAYNPGDNRPIIPSKAVLGAKKCKKCKKQKVKILRRTFPNM